MGCFSSISERDVSCSAIEKLLHMGDDKIYMFMFKTFIYLFVGLLCICIFLTAMYHCIFE